MTKIIKLYMDIGCSYKGDADTDNIYEDIENWNIKDCGIIGMLKLEIDTEGRTKNEILFRQILSPMYHKFSCSIADYKRYSSCVLKEFKGVDLFITFNGRDFDIPIILHNLNFSDSRKDIYSRYILSKDRDLLDLLILRKIPVKGGLEKIVKRLHIDHGLRCKNCPEYSDEEVCFLKSFDADTNRYNNSLKIVKQRNEFDVKILPLLEEKLGYLYDPRLFIDRYHKNWIRIG
jgi:hypothetical protein